MGAPAQTTLIPLTVQNAPLHHFRVEAAAGGNIGTQKAGEPFSIRITAQYADDSTVTGFTGTATLSDVIDLEGD